MQLKSTDAPAARLATLAGVQVVQPVPVTFTFVIADVPVFFSVTVIVTEVPAITFALGVLCLFFYRIDKRLEIQITDDLAERRRMYAPAADAPVPVPGP